jgi:polyisoprenoid-binding protein YceI
MGKHLKGLALTLLCVTGLYNIGYSQSRYKIKETKDVAIKLFGTSSLHDWEMEAITTTGEAQFEFKLGSESDPISIKSLSFALQVADLKSDNKGLDKKAYEALKSDEFKDIQYELISSTISPEKGGYLIQSTGHLTIAGVTRAIVMDVYCMINAEGTITSKGSYKLKMTDYNIKPPSFMLGAMKTGDAITLDFAVVYQKKKGA